jgi:hypothetical protein
VKRSLRVILVAGSLVAAMAVTPRAFAGVSVGINFNFVLPPDVHVSATNVEPYYVGRVFYGPTGVWRPVYSFPVASEHGVVYKPYVYESGHPICRGYIPGPTKGYSSMVIEGQGRGHYNQGWYHGPYGHEHANDSHPGNEHQEHGSHHSKHAHHDADHR